MPRRLVTAVVAGALLLGPTACSDGRGDRDDDRTTSEGEKAADRLLASGLEQLDDGRTEAARSTFENVLTLDPDNAYAHYNLGLLAQQAGEEADAMEQYDAALAARPDLSAALYNKGMLTESDDLARAVDLYREAVAADPDFAPVHMRLGFALLHLGRRADGEKELAAGVRLDPAMADVDAPSYG